MRKLRIGLASNDGKTILDDHMGQAKDFYVFDVLEDGTYQLVEKKKNTSPEEEGKHGLDKKRSSVMDILNDCSVFVGGRMSPNFVKVRDNTKVQPVISKILEIPAFMEAFTKNFEHIYQLVEQRQNGERPKEIPTLE